MKNIKILPKEKKWNEVPAVLELYRNPGSKVEAGLLKRRRKKDYFGKKVSKK